MPTALPFRGLRYALGAGDDLSCRIAPPYDVIPEERRTVLAARHPNNIVHLDLPRATAGADAHRASAGLYRQWVRDGVLRRDESPAFYLCEQDYAAPSGHRVTRRGFFARLRIERLDSGIVIPHERTLEAPRADRLNLLAATRTHFSAVFMLHPDPGGAVAGALEERAAAGGLVEARDDDGTVHRLGRVEGTQATAWLQERLEGVWALIADGHHRYESALAYRDRRRAGGVDDAEHVLAYLCSLEDTGLSIFPIHRVVHSVAGFDPGAFRRSLESLFTLKRVEGARALGAEVAARAGRPGVFGLAFAGEPAYWLAEWIEGAGFDQTGIAEVPAPLRRLDVILLHRLVFEATLGITAEAQARQSYLEYVKDEKDLFARVAGGADLGVLLNATRIEQVVEVSRQKLRLPQKSTYFYPKVPTGLVLDPLDD